jgi:hypothetical protein
MTQMLAQPYPVARIFEVKKIEAKKDFLFYISISMFLTY